jgi:hypothetical protein
MSVVQPVFRSCVRPVTAALSGVFGAPTPSLLLNFTTGVLDPRITFSRNTTATRVNQSGLIESVAINAPRFDYDPVTLQPKGLLIEEQRTNLAFPSSDFSSANWIKTNIAINAATTIAPDGSVCNAYNSNDPSSLLKRLRFNHTTTTVGSHAWSMYVKAGTEDSCALSIQDNTGSNGAIVTVRLTDGAVTVAAANFGTATNASAKVEPFKNGFYRISIVATFVSALTAIQGILTFDGNLPSTSTGTLFPWGGQLETGSFSTSYIPATAVAVTRAGDAATMTGTNFSSWYNTLEGTMFAEGVSLDANRGNSCMFQIANGGINSFALIHASVRYAGSTPTTSRADVTSTLSIFSSIISNNTSIRKIALALKSSNFAACANGSAVTEQLSGALPTEFNQALLGSAIYAPAGHFCGHLRRVAYYRRRLSNAQLQAITA